MENIEVLSALYQTNEHIAPILKVNIRYLGEDMELNFRTDEFEKWFLSSMLFTNGSTGIAKGIHNKRKSYILGRERTDQIHKELRRYQKEILNHPRVRIKAIVK